MVLRTACPQAKADLTHAAWSAYLSGELPLRAPQEQPGMLGLLQPTLQQQQQQQESQHQLHEQEEWLQAEDQEAWQGRLKSQSQRQRQRQEVKARLEQQLPDHPARPERPQLVRPKEVSGAGG